MVVAFNKVREAHGWLGNMSPWTVIHEGNEYYTAEALFQCLRFDREDIRDEIRRPKSPMIAKMKAKSELYRDAMIVEQMGKQDLDNMRLVLKLKIEQHPELRDLLLATGDEEIVEDATTRQRGSGMFWGAALQPDGSWSGENWLGKLWSELRESLQKRVQI